VRAGISGYGGMDPPLSLLRRRRRQRPLDGPLRGSERARAHVGPRERGSLGKSSANAHAHTHTSSSAGWRLRWKLACRPPPLPSLPHRMINGFSLVREGILGVFGACSSGRGERKESCCGKSFTARTRSLGKRLRGAEARCLSTIERERKKSSSPFVPLSMAPKHVRDNCLQCYLMTHSSY